MSCVLVVDDDADIRGLLREVLERAGHDVIEAGDGERGAAAVPRRAARSRDSRCLDAGLRRLADARTNPRVERRAGRDAECASPGARQGSRSARGSRRLRHEAVRPPRAARARGRALRKGRTETDAPQSYADSFLTIDFAQRAVTAGGAQVPITPLEFRLLAAFVRNPNQVLSQDQLIELAWGARRGRGRDQVKLYVGYLRRKLGEAPGAGVADRDGSRIWLPVHAPGLVAG